VDPSVYKGFIAYILSDIAERRSQAGVVPKRGERRREFVAGESRRIFIAGKHVCYQGQESFRGSDATLRLRLAVTAAEQLERDTRKRRGANWSSCLHVAEALIASPCQRWRERFRHARGAKEDREKIRPIAKRAGRVPRFEELDALLDAQKASRAAPLRKLAAVIRNVVGRYRRSNPNWRQEFEIQFGAYRFTHRDQEWYGEQIAHWESWLADFERRTDPFEWWEAMPLANLAQISHEHGEFKRAAGYYRKAISAAQRAAVDDELRAALICYFEMQIKACEKRLGPPEPFIYLRLPRPESGTSSH